MEKVVLYGIGNEGSNLLANLQLQKNLKIKEKMEIICLTDKKAAEGLDQFMGYPVIAPDKLMEQEFDYIIVCSSKYYKEIEKELTEVYRQDSNKIVNYLDCFDIFRECNLCGKRAMMFHSSGINETIFDEKAVAGAGSRASAVCPHCGSLDRTRWVWYVLLHYTDLMEKHCSILHFAPERELNKKLVQNEGADYISGDICEGKADIVLDIRALPFENSRFDYIICNHVMEHIRQEKQAFDELKRCLKQTGRIILTIPINWGEDTFEDENVKLPEDCLRYYGQEDHVRLYGKDIVKRLERHGFSVKCYKVNQILKLDEIEKFCFIPNDTVFILRKK